MFFPPLFFHKLFGLGKTIAEPTLIAAVMGAALAIVGISANVWCLLAALFRDRIGGVAQLLECTVQRVIPVEPGGNHHYKGLVLDAGDLSVVLSGGWWIPGHADHGLVPQVVVKGPPRRDSWQLNSEFGFVFCAKRQLRQ